MIFPRYLFTVMLVLQLNLKAFGENKANPPSTFEESTEEVCLEGNCPQVSSKVQTPEGQENAAELRPGHNAPFGSHRAPDREVEILPYMISPEDFHQHFVSKHRPVLFKGGAKHWPAYTLWEDEYLSQHFGEADNLNLATELHPGMKKDVIIPLCLRCAEMYSKSFVTHLYTGTGDTSSKLHIDTEEKLLAVLRGAKTVLLVSPVHSNDVYADEADQLGVSPIDVEAVDMEKYPRVANVEYLTAEVSEGDLLYVPQMWWRLFRTAPGRQRDVVITWKSQPVRVQAQEQAELWRELKTAGKPERRYSFGQWLAASELWVQNVSSAAPRLTCDLQNSPMSLYSFETMKEDLENFNGPDYLDDERCVFDDQNPKCPCNYAPCLEDDQNPECVRYVMDYCLDFEDRGCVLELPQLLNKLRKPEFEELAQLKQDYVP